MIGGCAGVSRWFRTVLVLMRVVVVGGCEAHLRRSSLQGARLSTEDTAEQRRSDLHRTTSTFTLQPPLSPTALRTRAVLKEQGGQRSLQDLVTSALRREEQYLGGPQTQLYQQKEHRKSKEGE
jgi:hypothetical protein